MKTCTVIRKGKELNKSIGSKSLHPFVQRLLVPFVQTASRKATGPDEVLAELIQSRRRDSTGHNAQNVWRSGKLVNGQRNGHSPRTSDLPRKAIVNSVQIIEQLLWSPRYLKIKRHQAALSNAINYYFV